MGRVCYRLRTGMVVVGDGWDVVGSGGLVDGDRLGLGLGGVLFWLDRWMGGWYVWAKCGT